MFYEKIFRSLAEREIEYIITGGIALLFHGIVRFTADLDLMLKLTQKNLEMFLELMRELGFKPRLPVAPENLLNEELRLKWIKEKNLVAFTFYNPSNELEEIDIIIKYPIPYEEIEKEAVKIKFKDLWLPVISLEHLKKIKAESKRWQDIADLKAIEDLERMGDE